MTDLGHSSSIASHARSIATSSSARASRLYPVMDSAYTMRYLLSFCILALVAGCASEDVRQAVDASAFTLRAIAEQSSDDHAATWAAAVTPAIEAAVVNIGRPEARLFPTITLAQEPAADRLAELTELTRRIESSTRIRAAGRSALGSPLLAKIPGYSLIAGAVATAAAAWRKYRKYKKALISTIAGVNEMAGGGSVADVKRIHDRDGVQDVIKPLVADSKHNEKG